MGDNDFEEREVDALRRLLVEARDRIARYEAGADSTPAQAGVERTSGQLWFELLHEDVSVRMSTLDGCARMARNASRCFVQDHQGRIDHLQFELQDVQAKLSATLGFDTPQSLHSLTVAVQALRNVMVEGIAARGTIGLEPLQGAVELGDEDFPQERTVAEKIGDQLKAAGIDSSSVCGYEWRGGQEGDVCNTHRCGVVNPLHVESHECSHCEKQLSHDQAERLLEANQ